MQKQAEKQARLVNDAHADAGAARRVGSTPLVPRKRSATERDDSDDAGDADDESRHPGARREEEEEDQEGEGGDDGEERGEQDQDDPAVANPRSARSTRLALQRIVVGSSDVDNDDRFPVRRRLAPPHSSSVDVWFEQDAITYRTTQVEPSLRRGMVTMAMKIAGKETARAWKEYFVTWREKGQITSRPTSRAGDALLVRYRGTLPPEITRFYQAYGDVRTADALRSFKAITHRARLVQLHQYYNQAMDVSLPQLPLPRTGMTRRAQRKEWLFSLLHPEHDNVNDVKQDRRSKPDWNAFTSQLRYATRWQRLAAEFGYGILGLIPDEAVPASWVQRTLNESQFELWIRVIDHFNPRCRTASLNWTYVVSKAIARQRPSRKKMRLEEVGSTSPDLVQDPTAFFCVDGEAGPSEDESGEPSSSLTLDMEAQEEIMRDFFQTIDQVSILPGPQLGTEQQTPSWDAFPLPPLEYSGSSSTFSSQDSQLTFFSSDPIVGGEGW